MFSCIGGAGISPSVSLCKYPSQEYWSLHVYYARHAILFSTFIVCFWRSCIPRHFLDSRLRTIYRLECAHQPALQVTVCTPKFDQEGTLHVHFGIFDVDMKATRSDSTATPSVTGKANISETPLSGFVPALVIIHAVCLAGSFLLVYSLEMIALRWPLRWFNRV